MSKSKIYKKTTRGPQVDTMPAEKSEAGGPPTVDRKTTANTALQATALMRTTQGSSAKGDATTAQASTTLQRTVGNARVGRLVQDGAAQEGQVQARLEVSRVGDPHELEADRVADSVTSGHSPQPISRYISPEARRMAEGEDEKPAQTMEEDEKPAQTMEEEEKPAQTMSEEEKNPAQADAETTAGKDSHEVHDPSLEARVRAPGGGRPLPEGVRGSMERATGHDLSAVRLHDTPRDRADARRLKARAFARDKHIWLGPGQSSGDARLLSHELTHVVQQGSAGPRKQDKTQETSTTPKTDKKP